jgi:hypothetical protein
MAPQTTTTKLDTSESQGTRPADAPEGSSLGENADGNFKGTGQTQANSSDSLPKPNDKLSTETINDREFMIQFIADEEEKVFDEEYLNEDHLLLRYWELLKQILETPCDERAEAYKSQ